MRKFIIDTDTASDDAVAILMALEWPDVEVECVTIVSGNMPVEQGSINARYTIELCNKQVPVYIGCDKPLVKKREDAKWFHGEDGMGDKFYPDPKTPAAKGHAVDVMIQKIMSHPIDTFTIVTLGPLTNLAMAIRKQPKIVERIKNIVTMAGAPCCVGNITPAAEWNVWCDPEAAEIVYSSGHKDITLAGWDLCRGEANLTEEDMEYVYSFKTKKGNFAIDCNKHALRSSMEWLSDPGLGLPDPVAMAVALDKSVVPKMSKHTVKIPLDGPARGMTIVDQLNVGGVEPNLDPYWSHSGKENLVNICWSYDAKKWKEMLYQCLRN